MKKIAFGRVLVWQGCSLRIGKSTSVTDTHAHHAIQISLALDGSFQLKGSDEKWKKCTGAFIPPHYVHALASTESVPGTIFVEPELYEGRILLDLFGTERIRSIPRDMATSAISLLRDAYGSTGDDTKLLDAAREVVHILTAGTEPRRVVDPRILQAIELLSERLHRPIKQDEIAEAVFLSPSRFRHLWVVETGMPFRPYVLWMRLQRVLADWMNDESLTNAAHAAGFSDLAHMSRTFKRMFGMSPTMFERDRGSISNPVLPFRS